MYLGENIFHRVEYGLYNTLVQKPRMGDREFCHVSVYEFSNFWILWQNLNKINIFWIKLRLK